MKIYPANAFKKKNKNIRGLGCTGCHVSSSGHVFLLNSTANYPCRQVSFGAQIFSRWMRDVCNDDYDFPQRMF